MSAKKRLDLVLIDRNLVSSRQRARALIMAGKVFVDNQRIEKPGVGIVPDAVIEIKGEDLAFVSRGGLKLQAALDSLLFSVDGLVCLDVGASTGGFTDCLLQRGARHVFAVDVGYGQLAWSLRQDARVTLIERTNIRYMPKDKLGRLVDLVTIDVSFISLRIVVPAVLPFIKPDGRILALIKPQFEAGKGKVAKGGVVKDAHVRAEIIKDLTVFFHQLGLDCGPVIPSPILGPKGNQEYIVLLSFTKRDTSKAPD
jgi:23S rRNA (cytidine1920-2'-O)/16S rRNA (cytidine1409-2'-O)-methyltransferase